MKTRWFQTFTIMMLSGLLATACQAGEQSDEGGISPKQELRMKQALVVRDMKATEELCRLQCRSDFAQAAKKFKTWHNQASAKQALQSLMKEHPHMQYLEFTDNKRSKAANRETVKVQSAKLHPKAVLTFSKELQAAKQQALQDNRPYTSKTLMLEGTPHFILAMPQDGGVLVGIVHQGILNHVKHEQGQNLRLEKQSPAHRYGIKTVDSDTLRRKKVKHPEHQEGTSHYYEQEVVVKFPIQPDAKTLRQIQKEIQGLDEGRKVGYTYVFRSRSMTAKQLMQYFQKWKVVYAEPHFLYNTNDQSANRAAEPNDDLYAPYQWNLPLISTPEGWNITKGSEDTIVAVVDTGVDLEHPDLVNRLVEGMNFVNPDEGPWDDVGHGTHVAGVIAADVNNLEGVAGMTWYPKIMPIKVLDASGTGSTYDVAQGIIWAADHGADVINLSLGNYAEAEFLHDAIRYAHDKNVVLIAATGNDNTEEPGYPAAYPEVFAVGATDEHQERAFFSNYGDYTDVAAPGVNIASTYPDNQYASLSGTSMACPHVSALAALLRSANPMLTNTEVLQLMRESAQDLGRKGKDKFFGFGQIDVARALSLASGGVSSLSQWQDNSIRDLERIAAQYLQRM